VYADIEGNIARFGPGRAPIRAQGHDGLTPIDGWNSKNEWQGYVPFEHLPREFNPRRGFTGSANDKVKCYLHS